MGGVKLETARNPMEKLDRRQMALDGGRPQFLGSERVRHILEQLPHVGQTVAARLEKNGHTTTYPKVYPRAKMPLISAFRRGRNGDPHEFEANTEVLSRYEKMCVLHVRKKLSRLQLGSQSDEYG